MPYLKIEKSSTRSVTAMDRATPFLLRLEKVMANSASDWREVAEERRCRRRREMVAKIRQRRRREVVVEVEGGVGGGGGTLCRG
jgi:hypothetical protein